MATTTLADFITSLRYDLNDQGEMKWDDDYIVEMFNRGVRVMERELITLGSGLVVHRTSGTLSTGSNTMEVDATVDSVKRVYISQDEVYKISLGMLYRHQIDVIGSNTGQPELFATFGKPTGSSGRNIVFDYTADSDYTIDYIYNKLTGNLTTTDYMPYDDMFNDYLREGIVVLCQKAKDDKVVQVDNIWRELFRQHMYQYSVTADFAPRYRVDPYWNVGGGM